MARRALITPHELLELIRSLPANPAGWVQAPGGKDFTGFLSKKAGYKSIFSVHKMLNTLEETGCIEKCYDGRKFFRLRLTGKKWGDPAVLPAPQILKKNEVPENPEVPLAESQKPILPEMPDQTIPERGFAVFIDYKNLEHNLGSGDIKLRNYSWILDKLLKEGRIITGFVFIPDHYATRIPLAQITHLQRFHVVICPRERENGLTKDKDTVDSRMISLARHEIGHREVTDLVIVSGDGDFQELVVHARWQRKNVTVISPKSATSGKYLQMKNAGLLNTLITI